MTKSAKHFYITIDLSVNFNVLVIGLDLIHPLAFKNIHLLDRQKKVYISFHISPMRKTSKNGNTRGISEIFEKEWIKILVSYRALKVEFRFEIPLSYALQPSTMYMHSHSQHQNTGINLFLTVLIVVYF